MKNTLKYLHFDYHTKEKRNTLRAIENFVSANNQYDFLYIACCGATETENGQFSTPQTTLCLIKHQFSASTFSVNSPTSYNYQSSLYFP